MPEVIGYFHKHHQPAIVDTLKQSGRLSNISPMMIEHIASVMFDKKYFSQTVRGWTIHEEDLDDTIEFMKNQLELYQ